MSSCADAGLASDYWHGYYSPEEVAEVLAASSSVTQLVSEGVPIHVRVYGQPGPAPVVVMGHGMLVYGLALARLQLPFYRAGFTVVQFDLPGMGQSGGPRAGCTIDDLLPAWAAALEFARSQYGGPLFVMGVAEDGVSGYYAAANRPGVEAISLHTLFEYGDPGGVAWLGPPLLARVKSLGIRMLAALAPTGTMPATKGIPYEDVFGGPGDNEFVTRLLGDPLGLHEIEYRFSASLVRPRRLPVRFEECSTPVQIIASTANRIWPVDMLRRTYARLGGPKNFVELPDKPQWESNREFHENYCSHVIDWFQENGAGAIPRPLSQARRGRHAATA